MKELEAESPLTRQLAGNWFSIEIDLI